MWRKWLHNNWKRWLIIITCLGLVTVRLIWPHIQFDAVTIWLIVIAAFFLIIPEPRVFFPYIKRVKLWEAEIELKEEVKELGREVDKAQLDFVHFLLGSEAFSVAQTPFRSLLEDAQSPPERVEWPYE